ncbi:MAG: glycogen/starch/alpha-glucan phosphorylase [Burkholderiales bacterium]|nr:glycogen/starch/alpha-glucan phosphorylase [Burkholderiales bacterium]
MTTAPETTDLASDAPEPREVEAFRSAILGKLRYMVAKEPDYACDHDWLIATSLAARDRVIDRWSHSTRRTYRDGRKRVYYFSLEFLIGRMLFDALANLGLAGAARAALAELGVDFDRLRELEPDPALGNGGLGRLAACFMESMATLGIPAHGYGIRYDHGIFRQVLKDGWQHEMPEEWLAFGNPWEFERSEVIYTVGFGGRVEEIVDTDGTHRTVWHHAETVNAVAFDTPIPGWHGRHVNTLRLWSARATDPLRLEDFNRGDHVGALANRVRLEAISRVLYPSDETTAGQDLRLRQEYFFAAASLQDLVRRHLAQHGELRSLPAHVSIQLNDTHPAIAVPELMRLLVDEYAIAWDEAWGIVTRVFNYTNHTLLPEALETWGVPRLESLLPRHLQIIIRINAAHLDALRAAGHGDDALMSSLSLIDERGERRVRMAHLAFIGARRVNGVSELHTELLRETVFRDFHALYPDRIVNKTNGVSFRRWLFQANPQLTSLLVDTVGKGVLDDVNRLGQFASFAEDASVRERFAALRRVNKVALARRVADCTGVRLDPDAMFDVHVKRIHEYKRQLLNIMQTIALYQAMRSDPHRGWVPRVKIFAGKAAAGYLRAKLVIKLIHDVARVVNGDPAVQGLLRVVFLPNYNVSLAEQIIPAADLSEQISTAGMEASGTGNMKLALNGALTIGTLDGANIELREHVGAGNFFLFGLTADEVTARRGAGLGTDDLIAASPTLAAVLAALDSGAFAADDPGRYRELVAALRYNDYFVVNADFDAYAAAQRTVDDRWRNRDAWWRTAIANTSNVGYFSSDRAISEYASDVWGLPTVVR